MATSTSWRRFAFFEKGEKKALRDCVFADVPSSQQPPRILPQTCSYVPERAYGEESPCSSQVVLGDSSGCIHFTDENCQFLYRFQAFTGRLLFAKPAISLSRDPRRRAFLVAVGLDASADSTKGNLEYIIKIWNLHNLSNVLESTNKDGSGASMAPPSPFRTIRHAATHEVCTFACTSDASKLALGHSDATITLLHVDLAGSSSRKPTRLTFTEESGHVVSNLHFAERYFGTDRRVRLFATSVGPPEEKSNFQPAGMVVAFDVSSSNNSFPHVILDDRGCAPACAAFDSTGHLFMAGRDDGVYSFTAEDWQEAGPAGAAAFDGRKQLLSVIVGDSPGRQPSYTLVASHNEKSNRTEINLYDLSNKYVAFNHRLDPDQTVVAVLKAFGTAFIVTSSFTILRIREKGTEDKLNLLYQMKYYPQAILLAKAASYTEEKVNKIYRMYGDHKYRKCDWDGAIEQYNHTIGYTEPSYVIRRFLDAQRIQNLTAYLERLHAVDSGVHATKDHTTLLLNCYTKLKDVEKLDRFISAGHGHFDVETAINVLRSSGYTAHALKLVKTHPHEKQHDWYMQIQLDRTTEDGSNFTEAFDYLSGLDLHEVEYLLKTHGKLLMTHLPEKTTGLLMAICTGTYNADDESKKATEKCRPEDFIHLFVAHQSWLRNFLEHVQREEERVSTLIANTLLELLLSDLSSFSHELKTASRASVTPASPLDPLSSTPSSTQPQQQAAQQPKDVNSDATLNQKKARVMDLLKSHDKAPYDRYHALVLMQVHDFKDGQLYLYKQLSRDSSTADLGGVTTDLLVEHHQASNKFDEILQLCKDNSRANTKPNPELWSKVLSHLVAHCEIAPGKCDDEDDLEEAYDSVEGFLQDIERDNILPPFQVVKILSTNKTLPVKVTKTYLAHFMNDCMNAIEDDRRQIFSLNASTTRMAARIGDVGLRAKSTDAGGSGGTVFSEANKYEEIKRSMSKGATSADNEARFHELENSTDGFGTIAKFFGQGMIR